MREKDDSQNLYRYSPSSRKKELPTPMVEEEIERYYKLVRLKLAPSKLRLISIVNIFIIAGTIATFFLGSLLMEKPTESKMEKRPLAKMPVFTVASLFNGTLTRDIETYFADTFPFREGFVGLSAVIDESRGIRVDDVRIIEHSGGRNEAQDIPEDVVTPPMETASSKQEQQLAVSSQSSEATAETSSSEAPAAPPEDEGAVGAISDGTFVYKGMAMSLFGGSSQSASWYAEVLNTYKKELPDVQIYNMIIPTAIEFYVPQKYRDLTQSQKKVIDQVYSELDSSIKKVDAYSKLEAHKDEYLYFRTDHHWTGLGAYYAYTAFCEQAGFQPISLADCETRRLDQFIGTMYAQTQDSTLLKNPDYVDYYIFPQEYTAVRYAKNAPYNPIPHTLWGEYAQSPNSYSVFLHGDFPLIKVNTGNRNGRKIMIVKESFGNAFAPYLINHYEEVYIVDQRYFQLSSIAFIKENGINELIFANNSFAVCTPYHIRCIDNMRHQQFVPYVPPAPVASEVESEPEEEREVQPEKKKTAKKATPKENED